MDFKFDFEDSYKSLLYDIISKGSLEKNRTGVDCYTIANAMLKFDASGTDSIPIITGKKIFYKKAIAEYKWIVMGLTTTTYLHQNDIRWWDEYANDRGELGKTYGYQLRNFNGSFDQIDYVCNQLKRGSRRAHITMWNPTELNETALPCCYTGFTFVITGQGKKLNLNMNFRSSDVFLGLPFDIIFGYKLLQEVAEFCELEMGEIAYCLSNAHVYENHKDKVIEYIDLPIYPLPTIDKKTGDILNYKHGPYISVPLNN